MQRYSAWCLPPWGVLELHQMRTPRYFSLNSFPWNSQTNLPFLKACSQWPSPTLSHWPWLCSAQVCTILTTEKPTLCDYLLPLLSYFDFSCFISNHYCWPWIWCCRDIQTWEERKTAFQPQRLHAKGRKKVKPMLVFSSTNWTSNVMKINFYVYSFH